jgi:hydroxylamine reductase
MGICGKSPETAALQDLIVHVVMGISQYAHHARLLGKTDSAIDTKTLEALFLTLTNVNFDVDEHIEYIHDLAEYLEKAKALYKSVAPEAEAITGPAQWTVNYDRIALMAYAHSLSISLRQARDGADLVGLQELVTYGIKGLAAYAHHALLLGFQDNSVAAFVHEALDYLSKPAGQQSEGDLLALALKTGEVNVKVMALLDKAHTETFGHPEPTLARTTPVAGKAILVSGHDLKSLYELLKQTENKGVNVYTHGELLPALAYPAMKKFPHLVGNYGGAWQNQTREFAEFPGAILMTTNCLKPVMPEYQDRIFTMDVVGHEGVHKLADYDFSAVIETALKAPGFAESSQLKGITIGFARNTVLSVAGQVIDAVKAGKIRHFFLIGGCDGAEFSRNYFSDLAQQVPKDCVILTLGCGKYRFNMEEFGTIDGIPRLLDLGQCNDAYSAVQIATALAEAFGVSINELPLSLIISWFEQKAVAVLLSLLYLGVKNIRIGPNLPAFVTPKVLNQLVEAYKIAPVTTPEKDLETILGPVCV